MTEVLPRLMTVETVASQLDVHPETLRRAIRSGKLACYRLSGCIRIAPEQLAAYLESHLCPVQGQIALPSRSIEGSGISSGGTEMRAAGFRQERRTQRALDKASRTLNPVLSVVRRS